MGINTNNFFFYNKLIFRSGSETPSSSSGRQKILNQSILSLKTGKIPTNAKLENLTLPELKKLLVVLKSPATKSKIRNPKARMKLYRFTIHTEVLYEYHRIGRAIIKGHIPMIDIKKMLIFDATSLHVLLNCITNKSRNSIKFQTNLKNNPKFKTRFTKLQNLFMSLIKSANARQKI